ncbi:MAG: prolipoprotein diacylglyceryl transferase [Actinobacteria bacterium]|nr:prolipoprotein diacylglyceryl transferase [Actinomycetota bacterium]
MDPIAAVITLNLDPTIELGPLSLAWHGIMSAAGLATGAWAAVRVARERGMATDPVWAATIAAAIAGIAGARILFLVENDAGALLDPGDLLGTHGFSIYGGIVFGGLAAALVLRGTGRPLPYLDVLATGFPLGLAVGRIGDVINGEHFGPRSDLPWAIRYTHPEAEVPSANLGYHPGGLYEVALGLALLAIVWPLRHRLRRPGALLWSVIGLYAAGRFLMFFYRSDSAELALGLNGTQWLSLAIAAVAAAGLAWAVRAPLRSR